MAQTGDFFEQTPAMRLLNPRPRRYKYGMKTSDRLAVLEKVGSVRIGD